MPHTLRWSALALAALLVGCAAPAIQPTPAPTAAPADRFAARTVIFAAARAEVEFASGAELWHSEARPQQSPPSLRERRGRGPDGAEMVSGE